MNSSIYGLILTVGTKVIIKQNLNLLKQFKVKVLLRNYSTWHTWLKYIKPFGGCASPGPGQCSPFVDFVGCAGFKAGALRQGGEGGRETGSGEGREKERWEEMERGKGRTCSIASMGIDAPVGVYVSRLLTDIWFSTQIFGRQVLS